MKMRPKTKSLLILTMALILPVLGMLVSCGGGDDFGASGCPDGSLQANSTDVLTAPPDITFTTNSGGSRLLTPLVFTLTDENGVPRNSICVVLYTDGYWFSDDTYQTVTPGTGLQNRIIRETDDNGRVIVYWATEILPPQSTEDQKGQSYVDAYSGAIGDEFVFDWTVSALTSTGTTT